MEPAKKTETPGSAQSAHEVGGRAEARSNIFVAATVVSDEACGPVRIRNMSALGALIEGSVVPPEGSQVRIIRGHLKATGTIAWQDGNRAGVRFNSAVSLADWLPHGPRGQQQRIDKVVHAYRAGATGAPSSAALHNHSRVDLRRELLDLENSLRRIAEDLARDLAMCELHLQDVQLIDIAAQTLARVAAVVDERALRPNV